MKRHLIINLDKCGHESGQSGQNVDITWTECGQCGHHSGQCGHHSGQLGHHSGQRHFLMFLM